MNVHVLRGSKEEIADRVSRMRGEISEAIVFIDEPPDVPHPQAEDIFAEMEPFTVSAVGADYSRESLYSRMDGE